MAGCLLLHRHRHDVYSQNGEDGLLGQVFRRLGVTAGRFVEFGAWDGIHLCNSRRLFEQGWGGVFLEADGDRYLELLCNYAHSDRVRCLRRMVQASGPDSLDAILDEVLPAGSEIDFCSIDVDGLDWEIFEGLRRHRPRVVCVEVNAGFHPLVKQRIPRQVAARNIGQSLWTMTETARRKGYEILCYTGNAIYVRREDAVAADLAVGGDLVEHYRNFYQGLDDQAREWLRGVNDGSNPPYFRFHNPLIQ